MKFKLLVFTYSLLVFAGCYNGDKTLIPKQPFVPLEVEEGYNLKVQPKVDILFLIDNSGSMGSAQQKLAQNIDLFTSEMEKNEFLDYQIGVITSSFGEDYPSQSGLLQGVPKYVTRSMANGLDDLERNIVTIGTSGDFEEKFFDPLAAAINPSLNLNPGFIRSDAFFVLIIVTDTTDQSKLASSFKVHNTLVDMKAYDADRVLGYTVLSYPTFFRDNCGQDDREPDNLLDFMSYFTNAYDTKIGGGVTTPTSIFAPKIAKLTNVFSLCDPNFGLKLSKIGEDIRVRVSQKIPLPVRPVDGTIKLRYGIQVIDQKWWRYDFGTNSIILDPELVLDNNQPDPNPQLFVTMDQADVTQTLGKPPQSN